uniref:HECT domain-containing protein n=1 Tax=Amphimedon queenslandica TaxID=400682 RepID=A0A1X7UFQ4_AMPQE
MLLQKIEMEQDSKSLQQVLMESFDIIANAGYTKPIPSVSTQDKKDIQRAIALQYIILQCITELEQFKRGLSSIHFLDIVRANREVAAPFFIKRNEKLTAGTNMRSREEEVYMYFVRLLNECEESTDPDHLTLADILIFFSGVDSIPPLGFSSSPTLTFHNKDFPSSSTCALTLTLPIHSDYMSFKAKVTFGMKHHGGFEKP